MIFVLIYIKENLKKKKLQVEGKGNRGERDNISKIKGLKEVRDGKGYWRKSKDGWQKYVGFRRYDWKEGNDMEDFEYQGESNWVSGSFLEIFFYRKVIKFELCFGNFNLIEDCRLYWNRILVRVSNYQGYYC